MINDIEVNSFNFLDVNDTTRVARPLRRRRGYCAAVRGKGS